MFTTCSIYMTYIYNISFIFIYKYLIFSVISSSTLISSQSKHSLQHSEWWRQVYCSMSLPLLSQSYTYNVPCSINDYLSFIPQVEDIDNDETACIIANLIYEVKFNCYMKTEVLWPVVSTCVFIPWHIFILQNKIKGYISHQHQKLVVSKQNAFPKLSTVLWSQTFSWLRLRSINPDCLFKMKLLSLLRKVHVHWQDISDKFKVVSMILYYCVNCFEITDSSKNTKEIVLNYSTIGK